MSEPPGWAPPTGPAEPAGESSGWPAPAGAPSGWRGPPPGAGWGPPPGWSPPPPPAQPGVVPLRPLAVGEILDGAFRTVRRQPRVTLGVAAVVTLVQLVVSLLAAASTGGALISTVRVQGGLPFRSAFTGAGLLSVLIGAAAGAVLTAMIAVIAADTVLGRPTGAGAAWRRVRPLVWRLLVIGVITTIGPLLGLLLLVVPGVFLWGAWALAVPAMVLERAGVAGSLRRSWRLAVPDWWRVWGTRALSALLAFLVSSLLSLPALFYGAFSLFRTEGRDVGVGSAIALTVTSSVASIVVAPFVAAVLALLYVDRRMRAEGLDVTLARSVGR